MARKATAGQKATAKKYVVRTTKSVGGKRVELDADTLKKRVLVAKTALVKKKNVAKKKANSNKMIGSPIDKAADARIISSTEAGKRRAKKFSKIIYKKKNPKTGKIELVTVRRKNATSHKGIGYITPTAGNVYTERRANRTDKGRSL